MRKLVYSVTGLIFLTSLGSSWAQSLPATPEPGASSSSAASAPTNIVTELDRSKHTIRAGDQLEIHIFALPDLPSNYTVMSDGTFFHPVAGEVRAAGLTLDKLQANLARRFAKELRVPKFQIGLHSAAQKEVAVLGEVKQQGKMVMARGGTLLDLLAQAGGLTGKADQENAVVLRQGKQIPVNLTPENRATLASFRMQNGDVLYVSPGRRISVLGEVKETGVYAVSANSHTQIEDALKAAGGAKQTAALSRVLVLKTRSATPLQVDLLSEAYQKSPPVLEDGDSVVIPPRQAILFGAFSKTGVLPLRGDETLVDVLSQGGVTNGHLDSVVVVRAEDVQGGTSKKEIYDFTKGFEEGQSVAQVPVRDGDLVYVPPKEQGGGFNFLSMLLMARSLLSF